MEDNKVFTITLLFDTASKLFDCAKGNWKVQNTKLIHHRPSKHQGTYQSLLEATSANLTFIFRELRH
jgi:hypothetical protein